MLFDLLWFAAGSALLYFGSDWLIDGSSALAVSWGMQPITVGLTVVALATSSPEFAVSLDSAFAGRSSLAVGNLLGSNIMNIALVLGIAAMLRPFQVRTEAVRGVSLTLIASCLLAGWAVWDGTVSRTEGTVLAALFLTHMGFSVYSTRAESWSLGRHEFRKELEASYDWRRDALKVALGLGVLLSGAHLVVQSAVEIASLWGISETVIGLTVVAVGTSLPELAAGSTAALKEQGDILMGSVIGSCIFNLLAVMGITAVIRPLATGDVLVSAAVMTGLAALLLPFFRPEYRISRIEAGFLLLVYSGYLVYLIVS